MPFTTTRLDDSAVDRLVKLYEQTANNLMSSFNDATSFGRSQRIALMAQIDAELKKLGVKTQDWLDKEIPIAYKSGMQDALTGLKTVQAQNVFYHGTGKMPLEASSTNMFGGGFYISDSKKVAAEFGSKVKPVYLNIFDPNEILKINSQEDYDKLVKNSLRAYPGKSTEEAIPAYAKSKGYKAILGTSNFDPLAGINVLYKELLSDNPILPIKTLFTQPNKSQVAALIDDSSKSFGDALTTVGRTARNITAKAFQQETRAKIAEGTLSGETRKQIVARVKDQLVQNGTTSLVDKGGRSWSVDRYADMLARTKLAEARNSGLATKMLENNQDLVQVSINGSDHPACADWEGQILSITGNTDGYDTVDDATADGLFHPNCRHTLNPIEPDLASKTYGWDVNAGEYSQGVFDNSED